MIIRSLICLKIVTIVQKMNQIPMDIDISFPEDHNVLHDCCYLCEEMEKEMEIKIEDMPMEIIDLEWIDPNKKSEEWKNFPKNSFINKRYRSISDQKRLDILLNGLEEKFESEEKLDQLVELGFKMMDQEGTISNNFITNVMERSILDQNHILFEIGMLAMYKYTDTNLYSKNDVKYLIEICHNNSILLKGNENRGYQYQRKILEDFYLGVFTYCRRCNKCFINCFCFVDES